MQRQDYARQDRYKTSYNNDNTSLLLTSRSNDAERGKVYEDMEDLIQYIKGDDNLILFSNWNVTVKAEKVKEVSVIY